MNTDEEVKTTPEAYGWHACRDWLNARCEIAIVTVWYKSRYEESQYFRHIAGPDCVAPMERTAPEAQSSALSEASRAWAVFRSNPSLDSAHIESAYSTYLTTLLDFEQAHTEAKSRKDYVPALWVVGAVSSSRVKTFDQWRAWLAVQ